tara:strand:+ start:624 stop:938 length:315 start_codon:yes stop_codon:yes gene_type:complete
MTIFIIVLSVILFIGLVIAILFEQYVVSLVLLVLTFLLAIKVATRKETNITLVPASKIKILGYPLKEISSTQIQCEEETTGETKGNYGKLRSEKNEEFQTEFDV